jgi:manganese/zinc/iron transport system substrate-binding protein
LQALDSLCRQQLAAIPADRRVLVTAHDAFGYFGAAYQLEVHGLQGISTADEADLTSVRQLVDLLVEREIKAVFVESSVPSKNLNSLIEACAARGHRVQLGGELYSDALGPTDSQADTYLGMVRHNVDTIVGALR